MGIEQAKITNTESSNMIDRYIERLELSIQNNPTDITTMIAMAIFLKRKNISDYQNHSFKISAEMNIKAKDIQNTFNTYSATGTTALSGGATIIGGVFGLLGEKSASKGLALFGNGTGAFKGVFENNNEGARQMANHELGRQKEKKEALDSIIHGENGGIQSLMQTLAETLRNAHEAFRSMLS